jgi:hypothetical protein
MGRHTGPGISLKGFALLEPAILITLEKDDKGLVTLKGVQLLKYIGYGTTIFITCLT